MNKPAYKKKLIEVAIPLAAINKESSKEKSIRQGHPSTLHLWWARRPLAACRAIIFASLVDDPSNYLPEKEAKKERARLFRLIEKLILWENICNTRVLLEAQKEIKKSVGDNVPPLLDPFCGGGSIPLEGQRLGLPVYASDLNPLAVLITKSMVEIPPKFAGNPPVNPGVLQKSDSSHYKSAEGLAADVEYYGKWMNIEAEKKIGIIYPKVNGSNVIVWIWTRVVKCPNPACAIEMPLVRSFVISKTGKKTWVLPIANIQDKTIRFELQTGDVGIPDGTVRNRAAECVTCKHPVTLEYIRNEGKSGRLYAKLMAIVVESDKGPQYFPPTPEHEKMAQNVKPTFKPEVDLPNYTRDFKTPIYGMKKISDLFTQRQLVALTTFNDLITNVHEMVLKDSINAGLKDDDKSLEDGGTGARSYADAISTYLTFAVDRCANYWSSLTPWSDTFIVQTFGRQAISMVWDFAEGNPFSNRTGNWLGSVEWVTRCLKQSIPAKGFGIVTQLDSSTNLFQNIKPLICTDPPYYDNISYSDLSDYFYVWARRALFKIYPKLFSTMLTPKNQELTAMAYRFNNDQKKADEHFLQGLENSFRLLHNTANPNFPVTLFYAYKEQDAENNSEQTSYASTGWETMLNGLISAGFQITGTWPIRTERDQGLKTGTNVLASSILLVCRSKAEDAALITRREFISALRKELPLSLTALQHGNIAPVDLAQAAIGPGMTVFSRYSKVLEADGTTMSIRTALQIINQELDSFLNSRESELDQITRFCISWYEQYGMQKGPYGEADVLTKAKNTSIQFLEKSGVIVSGEGKVKLLERSAYPDDLDLAKLEPISIWLCTQEFIRKLETEGEIGVAKLIKKIGAGQSELAKELSYVLYSIADKKGWTDDALSYNGLVNSWPSIQEKSGLSIVPIGQTRL